MLSVQTAAHVWPLILELLVNEGDCPKQGQRASKDIIITDKAPWQS